MDGRAIDRSMEPVNGGGFTVAGGGGGAPKTSITIDHLPLKEIRTAAAGAAAARHAIQPPIVISGTDGGGGGGGAVAVARPWSVRRPADTRWARVNSGNPSRRRGRTTEFRENPGHARYGATTDGSNSQCLGRDVLRVATTDRPTPGEVAVVTGQRVLELGSSGIS